MGVTVMNPERLRRIERLSAFAEELFARSLLRHCVRPHPRMVGHRLSIQVANRPHGLDGGGDTDWPRPLLPDTRTSPYRRFSKVLRTGICIYMS